MISLFRSRPSHGVADLRTARLRLITMTPGMLRAEQSADGSLRRLIRATVTAEWPPEHWEPHVLNFILRQYEDEPQTLGWHRYMLLPNGYGKPLLIGCLGGHPKPHGDVEIGYSTLPAFQRRGFATEAASVFVPWLLQQEGVRTVSAQTFPHLPESIKVMQRCGMVFTGNGDEAGTLRYCRAR